MTAETTASYAAWRNPWRIAGWGTIAALLQLPLVAGAPWTPLDYVFAAVVLGGVGVAFELAVRASRNLSYRGGGALAIAGGLLMLWITAAVGIIGDEGNPVNLVYVALVALEIVGAFAVRGRAAGMARVLGGVAGLQALFAAIVALAGVGASEPPGLVGILILNLAFVAMFGAAAALFAQAARRSE